MPDNGADRTHLRIMGCSQFLVVTLGRQRGRLRLFCGCGRRCALLSCIETRRPMRRFWATTYVNPSRCTEGTGAVATHQKSEHHKGTTGKGETANTATNSDAKESAHGKEKLLCARSRREEALPPQTRRHDGGMLCMCTHWVTRLHGCWRVVAKFANPLPLAVPQPPPGVLGDVSMGWLILTALLHDTVCCSRCFGRFCVAWRCDQCRSG